VKQGSTSFLKKRSKKLLFVLDRAGFTTRGPDSQKFFAELRAPMTERKRGLNRAAQLWFKKATSFLESF